MLPENFFKQKSPAAEWRRAACKVQAYLPVNSLQPGMQMCNTPLNARRCLSPLRSEKSPDACLDIMIESIVNAVITKKAPHGAGLYNKLCVTN